MANVAVRLTLRVPDRRTEAITGRLTMSFSLTDVRDPLVLDFARDRPALLGAVINGVYADVVAHAGHISINPSLLVDGRNEVAFTFIAGEAPLNRQDDFLYSLFVPARASQVFPCIDQPDIRARWTLSLDLPADWEAVSNRRAVRQSTGEGRTRFDFGETKPLPSYLVALAAGRFRVETVPAPALGDVRVFHLESDRTRLAANLEALVASHLGAVSWLEEYTAIAYPFDSLDLVLIPSMQFGGMEHPGAIFYNAETVLLDTSATQEQQLARANVIAHETAHMWFGNLVTMTWFDDVWLKEVFASLMAARIVEPDYPGMDHAHRFFVQHYPAAYDADRTAGATPIRQPLDNLNDAGSLYGPAIYQKAPIAMRHLERLIGPDVLRTGLRDYLSTFAYGHADWPDLMRVLSRHTSHDLERWSRAWIDTAGRPTLTISRAPAPGGATRVNVHQHAPSGQDLFWPQSTQLLLGTGTAHRCVDLTLDARTVTWLDQTGLPVDWTLPFGGGLAYGLASVDTTTLSQLAQCLTDLDDALTRTVAVTALWESMLDGRLLPSMLFDALLAALAGESDELTLQVLMQVTRETFWRFTPAHARIDAATRLEPVLRTSLERAESDRLRAAWFAGLRTMALTAPTLTWLEGVWRRSTTVPGLPLFETDETALALDLAVRLPESAQAIVADQIARIDDPQRRARLSFIAPALSPSAEARDAFQEHLTDRVPGDREAWVLDAMRHLHHPLRAEDSRHLILPALAALREIQRTGDIFFPRRWVAATLWGHQSCDAARVVRQFLDHLPADYPPKLRSTVLVAADPLMRASRILAGD